MTKQLADLEPLGDQFMRLTRATAAYLAVAVGREREMD